MTEINIIEDSNLRNYTKFFLESGKETTFQSNLVVRAYFTGYYDNYNGLDADFKDCLFKNVEFKNVSFEYDDFRNTVFYKAKFVNCSFKHSDYSQCSFYECDFISCNLNEIASFSNRYINTTFSNCSFERVIMRSGRFYGCFFESIKNSNRLFEDCIIHNTNFNSIKLYLSTIIYNYGLNQSLCKNYTIINDQSKEEIKINTLNEAIRRENFTPLEVFRLQYFIDNELTNHKIDVDEIISYETFLNEVVSLSSFLTVAETFSEFLSVLYNSDSLEVYYLVKIYDIFQELISNYSTNPDIGKLQSISWLLHIELQDYFSLESNLLSKINDESSAIIVSLDGLNEDQISNKLAPLSKEYGFNYNLIKRNSPYYIELSIYIIPILLIIINTLKKTQISIINKEIVTTKTTKNKEVTTIEHRKEISIIPSLRKKHLYSKGNSNVFKKVKDVIDVAGSIRDLFLS